MGSAASTSVTDSLHETSCQLHRGREKTVGQPRPDSVILSAQAWQQLARSLRLTKREIQIVRGIFDDQTELAIAANLGISTHTVHTHVERLHRKRGRWIGFRWFCW